MDRPCTRQKRLIPACAGKTGRPWYESGTPTAHPRVCGENGRRWSKGRRRPGSSPRVRGKLPSDCDSVYRFGLIPACAGKTLLGRSAARVQWAHPRVCGENSRTVPSRYSLRGSSPRVRGKRSRDMKGRSRVRLIPACAGKTLGSSRRRGCPRAHPRVCGENRAAPHSWRNRSGSSPRVRGKRATRSMKRYLARLIPACAGKTPHC